MVYWSHVVCEIYCVWVECICVLQQAKCGREIAFNAAQKLQCASVIAYLQAIPYCK